MQCRQAISRQTVSISYMHLRVVYITVVRMRHDTPVPSALLKQAPATKIIAVGSLCRFLLGFSACMEDEVFARCLLQLPPPPQPPPLLFFLLHTSMTGPSMPEPPRTGACSELGIDEQRGFSCAGNRFRPVSTVQAFSPESLLVSCWLGWQ